MEITSFVIGLGGLIVSGISLTLALKARSTAISAEKAADSARQAVFQTISISESAQAIALIELLKELHRNEDFSRALDRYTSLRQLITALQTRQADEDKLSFDNAIIQLIRIETTVREAVYTGRQTNIVQINADLLKVQQLLDEARVKQEQRVSGVSDIGGRS